MFDTTEVIEEDVGSSCDKSDNNDDASGSQTPATKSKVLRWVLGSDYL